MVERIHSSKKAKFKKEMQQSLAVKPSFENMYFDMWFSNNMIYCEDTTSFVRRLYHRFKDCKSHRDAQFVAFDVMDEMRQEFQKWVKEPVKEELRSRKK